MVVLKQTGKGHGRKYKPITERVSRPASQHNIPTAHLHYSGNMKTTNLLAGMFLPTAGTISRAVVMFTMSSEADQQNK